VAEGIQASLFFLMAHNGNVHPVRPSDTRWFESGQAFHAEVVQWQDEGL
jgi:hypothetical protein